MGLQKENSIAKQLSFLRKSKDLEEWATRHRKKEIQRYICRSCGRQFSETTLKGSDLSDSLGRVRSKKLCRGPALLLRGSEKFGWQ